jgi:hypothetical protein
MSYICKRPGLAISCAALIALLLPPGPSALGSNPVALFREAPSSETGIPWIHENGKSKQKYLPEMAGAGVAMFDYNNDGWMDLLLVNSGPSSFYEPTAPLHQALYRNNRDGTYTEVSRQAGLNTELFGMGVAIGDYDNDGFPDIFISGVGKCVLYHNNGNGTFTDVTETSGIVPSQWGTSAVWFDFDRDGKLDLFVAEFADYTTNRICSLAESYGGADPGFVQGESYYCHPKLLKPVPSHLYRNLGRGKFADVSVAMGIARPGKAWGVVAADVNGDGYTDLFVSNDTMPNFLWLNEGGKRFEEIGLLAGVGYSADGLPRSGMGVDATDFDRDGREDLLVANIDAETSSLYRNAGNNVFDDINQRTGLAAATRMFSGWGLQFFDYDDDGWPDLIMSNGHPDDTTDARHNGITYHQPLLLFHNEGGTKLENVSRRGGTAFHERYAARGLAVGDLNNDGYPDAVFTENGGPVHVLMNTAQAGNNWLGLQLLPRHTNPSAVGATICWSALGRVLCRQRTAGGSYLSSRDPRELLGAGDANFDWVEIHWPAPSTCVDHLSRPPMNLYLKVVECEEPR